MSRAEDADKGYQRSNSDVYELITQEGTVEEDELYRSLDRARKSIDDDIEQLLEENSIIQMTRLDNEEVSTIYTDADSLDSVERW